RRRHLLSLRHFRAPDDRRADASSADEHRHLPHSVLLIVTFSARMLVSAVALLGVASCGRTAGVAIVDVRPGRIEENALSIDVDVAGYEKGGNDVGRYCISLHFLPTAYIPDQTDPAAGYANEIDGQAREQQ